MRTAVDTSVLLDVLVDSPAYAKVSALALRKASREGALLVGECVVAELTPALGQEKVAEFLDDLGISFQPSTQACAMLAGEMYARYLKRRPGHIRVLPDFLIGAHARTLADRLLARDRGYYRDYFSGLKVLDPTT